MRVIRNLRVRIFSFEETNEKTLTQKEKQSNLDFPITKNPEIKR